MKYKVLGKQNNTDNCFVCGMLNDASAKAMFYECEKIPTDKDTPHPDEPESAMGNKVLLTIIKPKEFHQSYPNRMHGGVISALLDEAIGRAMQVIDPDIWAVTIDLNVKFRKPTPLNQTLYIEGYVTKQNSRTFDGYGKLFLADGTLCAYSTARYFIVPIDKAFDGEKLHDGNWFPVPEDLPEYIEL